MPTAVSTCKDLEHQLLTAEDFLEWLEEGRHADLIDGERFIHSRVNLKHANLLNFLDHLLRSYIEPRHLGRLYREVFAVRLSSRNVFLPDLAFFTSEQANQLQPTHAPMAPAFVVEALSLRTADRDVGPKFAAYEEHGVEEYWVLDPETLAHRFYHREGEILVEFARGKDVIVAHTIPGLWVKREWLNPEALPAVSASLETVLAGVPADA